jgi:hypothetical protein
MSHVVHNVDFCVVPDCKTLVEVATDTNGGLAVVDAYNYSGISADGDHICRDHFCDSCGLWHDHPRGYDRCANPPALPTCDRATALTVLASYGTVK